MKKLFIIAILSCNFLNAQSNLFPTTGNVGIGTTSPIYKLTVASDLPPYTFNMRPSGGLGLFAANVANLYGQLGWVRRTDQTPVLVLQGVEEFVAWRDVSIAKDGGNLGVGTDSPFYKLTITSALPAYSVQMRPHGGIGLFTNNVANLNAHFGWVRKPNSDPVLLLQGVQDGVAWRDVAIARDGGNVGIGTDSPFYKLTITSALPAYTFGMRPHGGIGLFTNNVANLNGQLGWVRKADQTPVLVLQGVEDGVAWRDVAIAKDGGNVGIGTVNPAYKLDVIGTVRAKEIRVNLSGADFVFEDGYQLMPLNELEKFVRQNKHLPEIAPAKEMQEKGSDLGSLTVQLLQKIEELTLHVIEQNKKMDLQNKEMNFQNKEMSLLKEKMRKLEQN